MSEKIVYRIKNIEEYGHLMAYCIEHDIRVWRTYWDERKKDERCYNIDWNDKICYYGSESYYRREGYTVVEPKFEFNEYGVVEIKE